MTLNEESSSSTRVGNATLTIDPSMVASNVLAATAAMTNHLRPWSVSGWRGTGMLKDFDEQPVWDAYSGGSACPSVCS